MGRLRSLALSAVVQLAEAGRKKAPSKPGPPPPAHTIYFGFPVELWLFTAACVLLLALFLRKVIPAGEKEDVFKSIFRGLCEGGEVRGNQTVRYAEFNAALKRNPDARRMVTLLADGQADLAAIFKEIDANGDGELTWAEWSKYVGQRRSALVRMHGIERVAPAHANPHPLPSGPTANGPPRRRALNLAMHRQASVIYKKVQKTAGLTKLSSNLTVVEGVEASAFVKALKAETGVLELFRLNGGSPEALIESLDTNGDGLITWEEFKTTVGNVRAVEMERRSSLSEPKKSS